MIPPYFRSAAILCWMLLSVLGFSVCSAIADDSKATSNAVKVFREYCVNCHGRTDDVSGDVNLASLNADKDLLDQPEVLEKLIDVLDVNSMPPEDEKPLPRDVRQELLKQFQAQLRKAVSQRTQTQRTPLRRMNRFQYNNAVQDLFGLKVVVFTLPERMLREHGNYFQPATGKMPETVQVGSRPLGKSQLIEARLAGVSAFPQDLRAEHGFDNRGDHLSLSPLLLESFLRLSRSIVESDDFNAKTVGVWNDFFEYPTASGSGSLDNVARLESVIRPRLEKFLLQAFRSPIDDALVNRYTQHAIDQIRSGRTFTEAMKSVAAAAIASPRFFYLYDAVSAESKQIREFNLASRLSFFLWGSIPDEELLQLAAENRLHEPDILSQQVERMLNDRKLKRFCDSFPAQWLQLEQIISATPDEKLYPQFYFAKYRASMHMMLEPLLLFETLLIEDQSILKLIDADFSYRSNLLKGWYESGEQGNPGSPTVVQFERVPVTDRRQGGVITNAAVMTMTSRATRTKPITRGAWIATVILNNPPEPPPADVPPLADKPTEAEKNLTLRERFAAHRERADCAACHMKIDPLGFALENYNAAGFWRDKYSNGRDVDASGVLFGTHEFHNVVEFKEALLADESRFARAFAKHLLAFALGREIGIDDELDLDEIVQQATQSDFRFHALIENIVQSRAFLQSSPTTH